KLKLDGDRVVDVSAEYESARALAGGAGLPLRTVIAQIEHTARHQFGLAVPAESEPSASPPPSGRPTDNKP
ncbi:MAG TPA: hypothetical protein VGR57_03960, partial [Ktedonobacterales bacterium]|nr:hypothetical protein [Ktedonobacterales bacterium]